MRSVPPNNALERVVTLVNGKAQEIAHCDVADLQFEGRNSLSPLLAYET